MLFLRRAAATLAAGYILTFFSEMMFWARFKPGEDSLAGYTLTWLAYSLSTFVFLSLLSLFRVRSLWALFLCGAVYGWLTEGVIVQTMYDSFPLNISFTGLAWHALISVWVGWYAMRKVILGNRIGNTLLVASLMGAFWGFWGICWRVEAPATAATVGGFALFAFTTTLVLIPAYWLYDRLIQDTYPPAKIELGIVGALFLLQFVVTAIPANFLALIVLPTLLLTVLLALRRNKQAETGDDLIQAMTGRARISVYLCLLAMPLIASTIYWLTDAIGLQAQTNWVVYLITTPLGAIVFVVSLIKVWARRPALPTPTPSLMPTITQITGIGLALLVVLGLVGAWRGLDMFVSSAMHPRRVPISHSPAEMGIAGYEDVSFVTVDGVKLRGWYVPSQNGAAVLLGHGHAGNREQNLKDAEILARHGYGVLLFDWRAHGESDGDRVTFGLNEVRDLDAAVDYVAARPDVDRDRIGMLGFSMGGSTGALGAARDTRIKAIIVEGAYAIFGDTARSRFGGLPLAGEMTVWWGELTTGLDADAIRPVDALCDISPRPVLLIYGTLEDGALAPGSAQQMFDAACEPKELWMISGAGHGGYAYVVPQEYEQRIIRFFEEALE